MLLSLVRRTAGFSRLLARGSPGLGHSCESPPGARSTCVSTLRRQAGTCRETECLAAKAVWVSSFRVVKCREYPPHPRQGPEVSRIQAQCAPHEYCRETMLFDRQRNPASALLRKRERCSSSWHSVCLRSPKRIYGALTEADDLHGSLWRLRHGRWCATLWLQGATYVPKPSLHGSFGVQPAQERVLAMSCVCGNLSIGRNEVLVRGRYRPQMWE